MIYFILFIVDLIGYFVRVEHDSEFRAYRWKSMPFFWMFYISEGSRIRASFILDSVALVILLLGSVVLPVFMAIFFHNAWELFWFFPFLFIFGLISAAIWSKSEEIGDTRKCLPWKHDWDKEWGYYYENTGEYIGNEPVRRRYSQVTYTCKHCKHSFTNK